MFTGIVESLGTVRRIVMTDLGCRLDIETDLPGLGIGDSVAVNGVCLTVVASPDGGFEADVMHETLLRTDLGTLEAGTSVDLERPLAASGRFDGHIVQGHVDGVGHVQTVEPEGDSVRMRIGIPEAISPYIAEKGSVAVDGVSLTVTAAGGDWFEVALIPHTLEVTVLGLRGPGDPVNIEVDVIAKYLERLMERKR
ncbi:MAG: riboflavin synthase [Gammaproteobacteria bacterium]|nr:riboflavin synthase [Gammaproteobacteria bacterium]